MKGFLAETKWFLGAVLVVFAVLAVLVVVLVNRAGTPPEPGSFLYVQQAQSGSFQPVGGGSYQLTLRDVWRQTSYFFDRPDRMSETIETEAFVRLDGMFTAGNSQNAAVVLEDRGNSDEDVVIAELTDPAYDLRARTLTYTAKVLDTVVPGLENWDRHSDAALPASFSAVSVFITAQPM